MNKPLANRFPVSEPRVRRGYFECRYGQLHVHNAIPAGQVPPHDCPSHVDVPPPVMVGHASHEMPHERGDLLSTHPPGQ